MRARLSAPAVALLLTACAAAVPGYTPPDFEGKKPRLAALEGGAIGSDGRYQMSSAEKEMDCKRLAGSMQITISRLKDGYIRKEPSALSSASQKMAAPVARGPAMTADREAIYNRERAKLDAYNEELAAKDCKRVDIEAELARPAESGKRY